MIEIILANDASYLLESADDCHNVGPCCFSCPLYDACDHHYEEGAA